MDAPARASRIGLEAVLPAGFSAPDRMGREEILPYVERLHRMLSIPVLYVSHDIGEIERLADVA